MKKKLLIIVLLLVLLITSFFVLTKKPNIKHKKLKELNYNLTYKQAFPDENLRRSVVLCIMRDKCNDLSIGYYYDYYNGSSHSYDTRNFLNDPKLGPEITEAELEAKEEEQLSKQALDKLKNIVPNNKNKKITTLQGIEYLSNLLKIDLSGIEQENLDFSYNKEIQYLKIYGSKIKTINLSQNLKIIEIDAVLSKEEISLDLSHLINLKSLRILWSGLKVVRLPNGVTSVDLNQNKITDINIPNSVTYLDLKINNLTHINLPEGIKHVDLNKNTITDINIPSTVKRLYMEYNNLTSITLPSGMEVAYLGYNKIENVTLRGPVETLILEKNNISHMDLVEGIKRLDLSSNKITNIILSESLKDIDLYDNKISHIDLPVGIQYANLSYNKISNIDVRNKSNLVSLDLLDNYLEDIDVSNNHKLEAVKFHLKNSKDTIDFSNNPKLREVEIHSENKGKIKSLDFSNNPDLYTLKLYSLGLTNLNIDSNINLDYITLSDNNLESLDLTNKTKLRYVNLFNNTSNLKLPVLTHNHTFDIRESRRLKIKKNSLVTIPTMIYNNKEFFIQDNPNYEKVGDKYVFKNIGTFNIREPFIEKVDGYWSKNGNVYYEFEVEAGEEDTFYAYVNQGNYTPLINEEITVNNLKEMIINLPANIKNFEIISPNTFPDKGDKSIKVRITFSDDTFKEVDIPVKVYEKEDILPTVTVTPETLEVIDKKPVNINIARSYAKEDNVDNTNFIKTVRDNLVNYEYLNKANGLTYNSNSVTGVIDYLFTGTEEEHTFNITYKEKGNIYTFNKNITIKLLRDTDKDGIADKDDDDKDGDGYSNAVEIAKGSDPYDKTSLPDMSKKDELDNLVKQLEKLIEDTKNNPFDNKNKIDVDKLKNNYLPLKVTEKDNIKGSYSTTTSDSDLLKLINKVKSEIDDIKKEINKLRDKANFEELEKEIAKEIDEDFYLEDTVKVLKDKIKEAKDMSKDTSTQEEVDEMKTTIKTLRNKLKINKKKLKSKIKDVEEVLDSSKYNEEEFLKLLKQAKDLCDKESFTKKEMLDMIEKLDNLLNRKESLVNPKTGIKTYSLIILFIIMISIFIFKKKKNYIR